MNISVTNGLVTRETERAGPSHPARENEVAAQLLTSLPPGARSPPLTSLLTQRRRRRSYSQIIPPPLIRVSCYSSYISLADQEAGRSMRIAPLRPSILPNSPLPLRTSSCDGPRRIQHRRRSSHQRPKFEIQVIPHPQRVAASYPVRLGAPPDGNSFLTIPISVWLCSSSTCTCEPLLVVTGRQ